MQKLTLKEALRSTKVQIIILSVAIVLLGLFVARGLIRGPFVSLMTTKLYAPSVDTAYNEHVQPVVNQLTPLGLRIDTAVHPWGDKTRCESVAFQFIFVTALCDQGFDGTSGLKTEQLETVWPKEEPKIKQALHDHGWKISPESNSSIFVKDLDQLVDDTKEEQMAAYIFQSGKVRCDTLFTYQSALANEVPTLRISSWCTRKIDIFGGV